MLASQKNEWILKVLFALLRIHVFHCSFVLDANMVTITQFLKKEKVDANAQQQRSVLEAHNKDIGIGSTFNYDNWQIKITESQR